MKYWIGLMVVLAGCKDPGLSSIPYCGGPCGTDTGECSVGYWACDEKGTPSSCVNATPPEVETCDGLDNDCDGEADNFVDDCSTACGTGKKWCREGQWERCTAPVPVTEQCNGLDDDCDGDIDESVDLPLEPCFSPDNPYSVGECRPGIKRCVNGRNICLGEVTPQTEVCDNKDNDCDEAIDEGVSPPLDIVVVLDESGSMTVAWPAIQAGIVAAVSKYKTNTDIRWAYVAIGSSTSFAYIDRVTPGFVSADAFLTALGSRQGGQGFSSEASEDAIYSVCVDDYPWTDNSNKMLLLFTDEAPQSYVWNFTPMELVDVCSAHSSQRYLFYDDYWRSQWGPFVPSLTLPPFNLYLTPTDMVTVVSQLVDANVCR